jgi:zinc D-Ala-D-Ala carboxypeptidase
MVSRNLKIFVIAFMLFFFLSLIIFGSNNFSVLKTSYFNGYFTKPTVKIEDNFVPTPSASSEPKPSPTSTTIPESNTHSIGQFVPNDLATLKSNYTTRSIQVSNLIVDDLYKMIDSAKLQGVDLKVVSGYRSFSTQKVLFESYVADEKQKAPGISEAEAIERANRYSAKPGHSEHQIGTTVDILSSETGYQFNSNPNKKYAVWLKQNASKYNFVISYPENNPEYIYEPWHLRWKK